MTNNTPLPIIIQKNLRQPKGPTALLLIGAIGTAIALVTWLVYITGGTVFAWLHLMYIPIIMAAAFFHLPGGIIAALIAGAALGPYMQLSVTKNIDQQTINWVFRICFFSAVGALTGIISKWLNTQIDKAEQAAYVDSLTGLPNLSAMELIYSSQAKPSHKNPFSLAVISFSNLTETINTLGYKSRPKIILQIAERLQNVPVKHSLFRLTDKTFAILSQNFDLQEFVAMCKGITKSLKEPFQYNNIPVALDMHIGIARQNGEENGGMTNLLQKARIAGFSAQQEQKLYKMYNKENDSLNIERLSLLGSINNAINNSELTLFLQPKVKISTRTVSGAETLIRWNHPEKGLIPPDMFIPEAEKTWIIHPLSLFAMKTVLRQIKHFEEQGRNLRLAVNLTAQNIQDRELIADFISMIRDFDINPKNLEVEITERILVTDLRTASDVLTSIKDLGALISVDDFGAGHSTMRYVKDLPIDAIKIDQSLISNLLTSDFSMIVVDHIFQIAQKMNLITIAEGVETEEIFTRLAEFGCDYAQGYLISKPLAEHDFENWLTSSPWGYREGDI